MIALVANPGFKISCLGKRLIVADIYWLEQSETNVPAANDWLSPGECLRLKDLRFAKRRAEWRLGRWTAKRALAIYLNLSDNRETLAQIEVRPAPSGAPELFLSGKPLANTISLSHSCGRAVCALAANEVALGCDLERIEARSNAFVTDYFTSEEQALIAQAPPADRSRLLALLWSAKESALKALEAGLRLDTRSVVAIPSELSSGLEGWQALRVQYSDEQVFHGWWRQDDDFMQAVVSALPFQRPLSLQSWPQKNRHPAVG